MGSPKFIIQNSKDSQFYFNLVAPNNEIIGTSEMYENKHGVNVGIASVVGNAIKEKFFIHIARNKQIYFVQRAANNKIILTSEMYESYLAAENGIDSVCTNAPKATIIDRT